MENSSNNTVERIKNLSNKDLYEILEFPEDYKPHLFELAEAELERRNLSEKEVEALRLFYQEKKATIQKNKEAIANREQAFKDWFKKFNPRGTNPGLARIYLACIGLGFVILLLIPYAVKVYFEVRAGYYKVDFYAFKILITPVLMLFSIGGLLKKQKFAWSLITIIVTYEIVKSFFYLYWNPSTEIGMIDLFNVTINLFWFIVYSVLMGLLFSKAVIEMLGISNLIKWTSIVVPIFFYLFANWSFIFPEQEPQLKMQDRLSIELEDIQNE